MMAAPPLVALGMALTAAAAEYQASAPLLDAYPPGSTEHDSALAAITTAATAAATAYATFAATPAAQTAMQAAVAAYLATPAGQATIAAAVGG